MESDSQNAEDSRVLWLSLVLAAGPIKVSSGDVSVQLPEAMCFVLPQLKYDAKRCSGYPAESVDQQRMLLATQNTERAQTLALAYGDSMQVLVLNVNVRGKRKGKMPPAFIDKLVNDAVEGAYAKPNPPREIETINGVTVLRIEMTIPINQKDIQSIGWTVLTSATNFSVTVQGLAPREKQLELGRKVLSTLVVPEKQRVDLTGKTPIPE